MLDYMGMPYQFGWLYRMFSGLRFRLLILVIIACTPLIAVTIRSASAERRHQVTNWRQRAQRVTQLAAKEENKLVAETSILLGAIEEPLRLRRQDRAECKNFLESELNRARNTKYSNIGLVGTNAEIFASAILFPNSAPG